MKKLLCLIIVIAFCIQANAQIQHGGEFRCYINNKRPVCIFFPHNYFDVPYRFPVLYLLHGTGGNEQSWFSEGNFINIIEAMISNGSCVPMVVVMPEVAPDMDGTYENEFGEIMRYVEDNFKVSKQKHNHAIAGLSMGGFYAMHISHHYPNAFDYVGLFSPIYTTKKMEIFNKDSASLFGIDEMSPKIYRNVESELKKQFQGKPELYYLAIGKGDFLYNQNVLFRKFLDSRGYPYEYKESGGGHEWKNWQLYIKNFLPRLFQTVTEKDLEPFNFNPNSNADDEDEEE